MKHKAHKYAVDVVAGKIVACKYCVLACQRYLDDLKTAKKNGLEFRQKTAEAYINFFKKCFIVVDYDGA